MQMEGESKYNEHTFEWAVFDIKALIQQNMFFN